MGHIDRTGSGETARFMQPSMPITTPTAIKQTMEVSTKQSKPTARNSMPKTMQNRKSEPAKVVPAPQQTTNAWTKPFVLSMKEFHVATSANRTKRTPSANQGQPFSKPHTQHQQTEEEQMDAVLETIHIALSGATSILRKISTGNTRLVHTLKKIMEEAMDAINTLTVYILITAFIRVIHTLQAEEGKLFRKPSFLKATQILFQICVKVMDLFSITTLIRMTNILLQGDPQ